MAHLRGTGSVPVLSDSEVQLPLEITVDVEVAPGGIAKAVGMTLTARSPDISIDGALLSHIARGFESLVDRVGARVIAEDHVRRSLEERLRVTQTHPTDEVRLVDGDGPPAAMGGGVLLLARRHYVDGIELELQRRRRSRLTDEDYRAVADVYKQALLAGESAQKAVAADRHVSQSRAASLIQETRKRGLLPPAKKGRKQVL